MTAAPAWSENMPILGDLYELLRKQSEPEAQNIATALEIYVNGSLNVFNHRSNIDMDSHRVLCFQLKSATASCASSLNPWAKP